MILTEEYILTELKKFTSTHKDYGLIITERNAERFAEDLVKNCSIPDVVGRSEQLKADEEPLVKGEQYVADYVEKHGKDLTSL